MRITNISSRSTTLFTTLISTMSSATAAKAPTMTRAAAQAMGSVSSGGMRSTSSSSAINNNNKNSMPAYIPTIDKDRVSLIQTEFPSAKLEPLDPIGASVYGIDLKQTRPSQDVINAFEAEMANRGFLVFKDQHELTADELVEATKWWGDHKMHSTHGVHPATPPGPNMRHVFRLSNDRNHGILGVGPQWHNDGSFEAAPFSHVAYHIVRVAENGGGTHFVHQGAAFDQLSVEDQEYWSRLSSVNSNSGVVHPVVHEHPISGRKCVWLHMGMTGAVIECTKDGNFRLLNRDEMKKLFLQYTALMSDGVEQGQYGIAYEYEPGDVLFIDNYIMGHRASPQAHLPASEQGLRIMHRTTGKAPFEGFEPKFGLPQYVNIHGPSPFGDGVWIGGGIGFRFDESLHYQN